MASAIKDISKGEFCASVFSPNLDTTTTFEHATNVCLFEKKFQFLCNKFCSQPKYSQVSCIVPDEYCVVVFLDYLKGSVFNLCPNQEPHISHHLERKKLDPNRIVELQRIWLPTHSKIFSTHLQPTENGAMS